MGTSKPIRHQAFCKESHSDHLEILFQMGVIDKLRGLDTSLDKMLKNMTQDERAEFVRSVSHVCLSRMNESY